MVRKNSTKKKDIEQVYEELTANLSGEYLDFDDHWSVLPPIQQPPMITCVINLLSKEYVYVSENVKQIFGFTAEKLKELGLALSSQHFIEPHRIVLLEEMIPLMFQWFEQFSQTARDIKKTRLTYSLNMLDKEGIEMSTFHIFTPLVINEIGFPVLLTKHIFKTPLPGELLPPTMVLEYMHGNGNTEVLYQKTFALPSKTGEVLSRREKEILHLMQEGNSSKEIADKLFISIHTFYNHRKSILKKYDSKHLLQVLSQA